MRSRPRLGLAEAPWLPPYPRQSFLVNTGKPVGSFSWNSSMPGKFLNCLRVLDSWRQSGISVVLTPLLFRAWGRGSFNEHIGRGDELNLNVASVTSGRPWAWDGVLNVPF